MANQNGIAVTIKGFLPTGKTMDEQFEAMSLVRAAQGDRHEVPELIRHLTDFSFDAVIKTRRGPKEEEAAE